MVRIAWPRSERRSGRVRLGSNAGADGLAFEFGRAGGATVTPLGQRVPSGRPAPDEDPAKPTWRTIGVDAPDIPAGADRVRIRAVDGRTDALERPAFTGRACDQPSV